MGEDIKTVIGKDVIESLTIGMYDDSRFIYREYIQNAADQIDNARQQGLISDGEIHITIDPDKKIISQPKNRFLFNKIHFLKNVNTLI